ncbi:uncharacterized protein LOC108332408 isoform X2 [Vigna angularis]|uniref:uncharacterized protein LOC108332408 isoform X2 n=1 Tax=Phaseolus angularis TaxID=3914 RepID=UPI0022B30B0D|nr:uncharacterized protein LOC108332408 isoform X2 [Vigna angularis]
MGLNGYCLPERESHSGRDRVIASREKVMAGLSRDQWLIEIFILGFGNIGMDLANRLQPFGVQVMATKRSWASYAQDAIKLSRNDERDLVDVKGSHEDIYDFARKADIVVCCLRLNNEMGALLVNIARGGIVDYEAVMNNLESGHLGGLGTDVAWTEPFNPDDQIFKFKNVIITPHFPGVTEHFYRSMAKVCGATSL